MVFANEDLKRHIFSFGYPEHREFTKSLNLLTVNCDPFIKIYETESGHRCIHEYIIEEYSETEMIEWMVYFNSCRCCTRHSHYKPYLSADGVNIPMNPRNEMNDCKCSCRSLARDFARAILYLS